VGEVLPAFSHRASLQMVHFTRLGLDPYMEAAKEQFHIQYHSKAAKAGIANLAQVRQKRGETVAEYI
jgi:hypothetical protein